MPSNSGKRRGKSVSNKGKRAEVEKTSRGSSTSEVESVAKHWSGIGLEDKDVPPEGEKPQEPSAGKPGASGQEGNPSESVVESKKRNSDGEKVSDDQRPCNPLDLDTSHPSLEGGMDDPEGNAFMEQGDEIPLDLDEEDQSLSAKKFVIEGEPCIIKGKVVKMPDQLGGLPMTACELRLTSGKIDWDVILDNNAPRSFVTKTVVEVEGKVMKTKIPIYGKPPRQKVTMDVRITNDTMISQVPFLVHDMEGVWRDRVRYQVVIGRDYLRVWRTQIEIGEHPNYLVDAKVNLSLMMATNQKMMHNNYVASGELCLRCKCYHSKPIREILQTGIAAERNCKGENLEEEWACYKKRFFSLNEFPEWNRCPYCTCLLSGYCRPDLSRNPSAVRNGGVGVDDDESYHSDASQARSQP